MELYIIRHSIAHNQFEDGSNSDSDRTLTPEGVERAKGVGRGLAALGVLPDAVLVSPATRTQQTAKHIFDQLPLPQAALHTDAAVGLSGHVDAIVHAIKNLPQHPGSIAIVGHQPTLGELISELLCGNSAMAVKVGRASVTRIDFTGPIASKAGLLVWKMNAAHLMSLGAAGSIAQ